MRAVVTQRTWNCVLLPCLRSGILAVGRGKGASEARPCRGAHGHLTCDHTGCLFGHSPQDEVTSLPGISPHALVRLPAGL